MLRSSSTKGCCRHSVSFPRLSEPSQLGRGGRGQSGMTGMITAQSTAPSLLHVAALLEVEAGLGRRRLVGRQCSRRFRASRSGRAGLETRSRRSDFEQDDLAGGGRAVMAVTRRERSLICAVAEVRTGAERRYPCGSSAFGIDGIELEEVLGVGCS